MTRVPWNEIDALEQELSTAGYENVRSEAIRGADVLLDFDFPQFDDRAIQRSISSGVHMDQNLDIVEYTIRFLGIPISNRNRLPRRKMESEVREVADRAGFPPGYDIRVMTQQEPRGPQYYAPHVEGRPGVEYYAEEFVGTATQLPNLYKTRMRLYL